MAYYEKFNVAVTILRLFNTIGPRQAGQYGMVVPRFMQSAINNTPITVYGSGIQTRSFADARDVVHILDALANQDKAIGEIVNVGADEEISINSLALIIKEITKSNSAIHHISYKEAYGGEYADVMHRRPDLTKLKKLITPVYNWELKKTITDMLSSIKNHAK